MTVNNAEQMRSRVGVLIVVLIASTVAELPAGDVAYQIEASVLPARQPPGALTLQVHIRSSDGRFERRGMLKLLPGSHPRSESGSGSREGHIRRASISGCGERSLGPDTTRSQLAPAAGADSVANALPFASRAVPSSRHELSSCLMIPIGLPATSGI